MTNPKRLTIAYIGGGSRGWAWGLMSDLATEKDLGGEVRLYDIDLEAARDNAIIGNRLSGRADVSGHWTYQAAPTLKEALAGADFVVISILPGTFDEMASDVHTPEQYGIYQAVGDTVGPGGIVRALRTIPMYVTIAEAIRDFCPNAWIINYTNPMSLCTRTLYAVFPEAKAFGCCHEVFGAQNLITEALREEGIQIGSRSDIKVNVLGINHFTWIDAVTYKGMNVMPVFLEFAKKHRESGFIEKKHWTDGSTTDAGQYFKSSHRVTFDLFARFGICASAGDRHLAEFCPGKWYLESPEAVSRWGYGLTPVAWRKNDLLDRIERGRKLRDGAEEFTLSNTGEEGVLQIKALLGLGDFVTNMNMPNRGQVVGLPMGAIVETNALFSLDNVRPLLAGKLPDPVHGMVARHVSNQETVLAAALQGDPELAFSAFIHDPLVTIGLSDARALYTTMLRNTKKYLPEAFHL
jgi:alpha-galactosidase